MRHRPSPLGENARPGRLILAVGMKVVAAAPGELCWKVGFHKRSDFGSKRLILFTVSGIHRLNLALNSVYQYHMHTYVM
ncbi:hypothetical protein TomTYG45_31570 [Sphingobium sp. TomTYG45]